MSSRWIWRYPLLFLVAVLSVRCCGVWYGSARSLALSAGACSYPLTAHAGVQLDHRRIRWYLFPSEILFEWAVLSTLQLIVRILRCLWHGGTRSKREWRAHATVHLSRVAGDSNVYAPYPVWFILALDGDAVAGTTVPSVSLLLTCTHRWVRRLRDTAVSALPVYGRILVSGVAIPAPTANLSLAPLLLLLLGDRSSGTSST